MRRRAILSSIGVALIIVACTSDPDEATTTIPPRPDSTTAAPVADTAVPEAPDEDLPVVFSDADERLSVAELEAFAEGQGFFDETWTAVGPTETATDGLGPLFNADSCAACHESTGRRHVPPDGPLDEAGLVIRLSVPGVSETGGPLPEPTYGDQLQDRAIGANDPEGTAYTNYVVQRGSYPDGTEFEILWPTVNIRDRRYGTLSDPTLVSARIGPQMIGMGLLEAIPEDLILGLADPDDADGDGISGRPNIVWNPISESHELGRFGWKANVATLELQIAQAFHGDLGVTSTLIPGSNCAPGQTICDEVPDGGTAEVSDERLAGIAFYLRTLAVPEPRTEGDPAALAGRERFAEFGCNSCHIDSVTTGESPVAALTGRDIAPYTDLLLHDLGFDMGDDRPDFAAGGNEWRTAPLWGLGLIPVDGDRGLLHDGRARTIEEAILWHGGEAAASRARFMGADRSARAELLAFLESL